MKMRGQTKRQAPVVGQSPGAISMGGRDPRVTHRTDQASASADTFVFPLRTDPATQKVELLNAANGAIGVDPERGQYVRTAAPMVVQSHSPFAVTLEFDPVSMMVKDGRLHAAPPLSRIRDDRVKLRPVPLRVTLDAVEAVAAAGVAAAAAAQADATAANTAIAAMPIEWRGTAVLVGGTVAVTLTGLTTGGTPMICLKTPGGTLGNGYKAACTADTLTITSEVAAGTIQALDTSTVFYQVWSV